MIICNPNKDTQTWLFKRKVENPIAIKIGFQMNIKFILLLFRKKKIVFLGFPKFKITDVNFW